jgi:hypothetical protein
MAAARIAAVFFALLCAEVCAQPAPKGSVTVRVTDQAGAVIPGASIEIDPSPSKSESALTTDNLGQAILNLPAGAYTLSITAPGFDKAILKIDVKGGAGKSIVAALRVLSYSGPPIVEPYFEYDPDLQTKSARSDMLIPLQTLLNLEPLTLKAFKRRW